MESRAKVLGHPAHQMLVVFPLGTLGVAPIFDGLAWLSRDPSWSDAARKMIGAGLIAGAVAAPFGLVDWLAVPEGTRARAIGRWHGLGNLAVMGLYGTSLLLRRRGRRPGLLAVGASTLGFCLAGVTAWLGGELVDRLGVGVEPDAGLDAPSSLATEPLVGSRPAPAPARN